MDFSIVLPSMWRALNETKKMLPIYEKCSRIKEIIIIDNDITRTPKLIGFSKIVYLPQEDNIYVNPAWNLGASIAKHTIILANDDVIIDDLEGLLDIYENSPYELIGCNLHSSVKTEKAINKFPANNFGCFMCVKNYLYIPEQIKVWRGDFFLFEKLKKSWVGGYIKTPMSVTVNDARLNIHPICKQDILEYGRLKSGKNNIIIRTSNRPNYFKNCIESVKKHCTDVQIHVTLDDEKDLAYVKQNAPDCSYYLIDKEKAKDFAKKMPIERDIFVHNYYLNIVKPFLDGWCLVLDDDDMLLDNPFVNNKKGNLYINKVDVAVKTVPRESFGKEVKMNDVSMIGLVFHSDDMVDFSPQRAGDYQFAYDMSKKVNVVWVDRLLSKVQTKTNHGKRNDLL